MTVQESFVSNATLPPGTTLSVIESLRQNVAGGVLCIVAETQGSTYRKPGALLLRGVQPAQGYLSGGCLEAEFEAVAQAVQLAQRPRWLVFNTHSDDDQVFGSASGCRGLIRVLLVPMTAAPGLRAALSLFDTSAELLHLHLRRDGGGSALLASTRMEWPGSTRSDDLADAPERALDLSLPAPPQVLLAGCGPEAAALIGQLRALGARVSAIEHRGRWSAHARHADHHIELSPQRAWIGLRPEAYAAALVMGHHYGNDLSHLREISRTSIAFVGLLGPPARRDALLADLGADATRLRERLHAPIGLRLGGEGPQMIALAIAAQLQQHFSGYRPENSP